MTYTVQSEISDTSAAAPSTVEKIKTLQKEGTERSQRIVKILRNAFSETAAEFKEGRAIISPLAKEVTTETVATVKEKGQQASQTVNQVWQQEAEAEDHTERLIRFVRVLAQATKEKLFPQIKTQASKLDSVLSDRYGQRYSNIKEQFDFTHAWYAAPEATPEPVNSDAVVIEVESEVIR